LDIRCLCSLRTSGIGARVAALGYDSQAVEQLGPTHIVSSANVAVERQVSVLEAKQSAAILRRQVNLDDRGAGRNAEARVLPAHREAKPARGDDFQILAAHRLVLTGIQREPPAGAWVDVQREPRPPQHFVAITEETEDKVRRCVDEYLFLEGIVIGHGS